MPDEVEVPVCCDAFAEALDAECLQIGQMDDGEFVEVVTSVSGEDSIVISFCPFCGEPRPRTAEPVIERAR
jgi:hypothetical protein